MKGFGQVESPTQILANFAEGFVGIKPLFSGAVQIGTWAPGGGFFDLNAQDVIGSLCGQDVSLNDGLTSTQLDPHTWTTWDDLDLPIKAQDYCLQKGVTPNWMTADELAGYQQNADGSITPTAAGTATGTSSILVPLAVAGGLVLLSLILIARR
jgi:hypothetical protein